MPFEKPEILLARASELRRRGLVSEAIEAYQGYLSLRPASPNSWYNLALLLRRSGRYYEALSAYEEALARGIDAPEEVHLNRAVIYVDDLAQDEAAERELKLALEARPDYVPALLNLGNLYEDRGDRGRARSIYEKAHQFAPEDTTALARLAGVSSVLGPDDPLLRKLRTGLDLAAPQEVAEMGFALGRLLDQLGQYPEAFRTYRLANEANRRCGGRAAIYDRDAQKLFVTRLIDQFRERGASLEAPTGPEPVFICGMFRSGSTLVEQILGGHSKISSCGELDLLPALIEKHLRPYPNAAADKIALSRVQQGYVEGLRRLSPDAPLVTDKRPDNFFHIGLIKAAFPNARVIHTIRHPLDNCLSVYFQHLDPAISYAHDLGDIAHFYEQHCRLMRHWMSLYPEDVFTVDYDRLVADPRTVVSKLLAFLSLDWDEDCLSFHDRPSLVRTASVWQVRKPLYRGSSGRWRNYEAELSHLKSQLSRDC